MVDTSDLSHSFTCSSSGWIDTEIFLHWLKWFDSQTVSSAEGRKRILHIDGHKTHTALEVDDYAAEHNIILLGYPPKTTHGLQGLDRVHFGRVKSLWGSRVQALDLDQGIEVGKEHFLRLVHEIWQDVFTPENNRKAFEITGLTRPVQPDRITAQMMAPSQGSSTQSSLPLPQPTPVREAARIISLVSNLQHAATQTPTHPRTHSVESDLSPASMKIDPILFTPTKRAHAIAQHLHLAHVTVSPLLQASPFAPTLTHLSPLPSPEKAVASPLPPDIEDPEILRAENDRLRQQLLEAHRELTEDRRVIRGQNAQLLLQDAHCTGLQNRLNNKSRQKKQSHVARYLEAGGDRIFTDERYRAAMRADRDAADKKDLDQLRRAAVTAATRDRAQWRREQRQKRGEANKRAEKRWREECADCEADGTQHPSRPKRARKEKTPERFAEAIEFAEQMDYDQLAQLRQATEGAGQGEERRGAILTALQVMIEVDGKDLDEDSEVED